MGGAYRSAGEEGTDGISRRRFLGYVLAAPILVTAADMTAPQRASASVPTVQPVDYYDLTDLFVYPRRAMRLTETVTPLKPLEAMARGGVVIAADVGGHRELIRHGETGLLFPADDAKALARALDAAITRRAQWPALGRAARDFIERERSWDRAAEGYLAAYSRALGRTITATPATTRRGEVA